MRHSVPRYSSTSRLPAATAIRACALLFLITALASRASAQQTADVVRGRVTDDSARAIVATVVVTRGPDRLVKQVTTDSSGAFSLTFDPGTGDYLVSVSAPGFSSARRRVQRQDTEHQLIANFTLRPDLAQLAAVHVKAERPVRATDRISPYEPETGSDEKWNDGVNASLSPSTVGDLNAIAGTMPNVTMTGDGPSILGSGSASNLMTLNGSGFAASSLPRAARTSTRVTAATFDPTRGGFAGANIDVQLDAGNRFYQQRNGYLSIAPQGLQFTDVVGRETGARTGSVHASLGADGELIRDALTYNVAVEVAHDESDAATLLDAANDVLLRAGLAPDSASHAIAVAAPLGIPLSGAGIPSLHKHDVLSWIGRFDDTRDTLKTRALTTYASSTRDGALGFAPLTVPSAGSAQRNSTLGAQLTLGDYVGAGRRILTETRLAASSVRSRTTPYTSFPGASVLVLSPVEDTSADVATIQLGGGSVGLGSTSRWTVEGSNETVWNTNGKKNHFKAMLWGRVDGLSESAISNPFGTFGFNSLADLAAGNADSYSRTLAEPARSGTVWNAAGAVGRQWAPSRFFSTIYGVRLEADGFASAPARNSLLESALGVRSDVAPVRFNLSPRIGFTYTYSKERSNGTGSHNDPVGTYYRPATGTLRGGIGEFRDLLKPDVLANAIGATGLANGTSLLSCVGAAVPTPDWNLFANDPGSTPARCLDGSGALTELAPQVSVISPKYDVPHSWRASLDWTSNIGSWMLRVATLGSYDLSQPGIIDANFTGTPRFYLADEGNRPVYVTTAGIDPASGAVSAAEARRSSDFGRVAMLTSDLRGYGGQVTTTIAPDVFKFQKHNSFYTSLSYTLQSSKREYRGFDGAAFGDPSVKEWAPSANDARHIIVLSGGINTPQTGTITLFGRFQSGLPFTPIVQGDVNGDGLSGDRAFIPNPATETDPVLASQLRSLLANGSSTARSCVTEYLGEVAARNGCRGPWTAMLNVQWAPPIPRRWLGRVKPNVYFENVLGAVDQVVHGPNSLRGWGAQPVVDPVLLVPHSFDPTTQRFSYYVNPRFADTRAVNTLIRNPFRITLDFTFDFSTNYDLQELRRAVEPVRSGRVWTRRNADSLTGFFLSRTSDIYKLLLQNSDSLLLTAQQTVAIKQADSAYSARVRAVYSGLGAYLAGHTDPGKPELDSASKVDKAYMKIFWEQPEIAGCDHHSAAARAHSRVERDDGGADVRARGVPVGLRQSRDAVGRPAKGAAEVATAARAR